MVQLDCNSLIKLSDCYSVSPIGWRDKDFTQRVAEEGGGAERDFSIFMLFFKIKHE